MRGWEADDGTLAVDQGLGRHYLKMDFNHVDGSDGVGK